MRVTYPVLDYIKKLEYDARYIRGAQNVEYHNSRLHKVHRQVVEDWVDLYNEKADKKRYENRTTIDIFV